MRVLFVLRSLLSAQRLHSAADTKPLSCILPSIREGEDIMNTPQDKTTEESAELNKIDPTAPAGSENSLGAESIRDGRPATDDSVVEAIDEMGPGVTDVPENTSSDSWTNKGEVEGNATRPKAKPDPQNGSL